MSNIVNHPGLKAILILDALTGIAVAALQFAVPQLLSLWLGLGVPLLVGSAVLLLGFVGLLLWMAQARQFRAGWLQMLVWGNGAWGIACLALATMLPGATLLGIAYLLVQTVTVWAFAAWQWRMGRVGRGQWESAQPA